MVKTVLLTIAYDGSLFHGWQKQPDCVTVQGHLERVMSKLFRRDILLSGTSRTDAGVHAFAQKASFVTDINIPTDRLPRVINNALCAEEKGPFAKAPIRILNATEMPEGFHARFNCKGKKYVYRICSGYEDAEESLRLVFDRNYAYYLKERLDIEAMAEAAEFIGGKKDFKSFEASGGNPRETTVRTVFDARIIEARQCHRGFLDAGDIACGIQNIEFHVSGDGFLYNMVRIMTGSLVEIGQGKRKAEDIIEIIEARNRSAAGHTAPPNGLYLTEVFY